MEKGKGKNSDNGFVWFPSLEVNAKDEKVDNIFTIRAIVQGHFRALVLRHVLKKGIKPGKENREDKWLDVVITLFWQVAKLVKASTSSLGRVPDILLQRNACVCFNLCHVSIQTEERVIYALQMTVKPHLLESVHLMEIKAPK